MRYLLLAMVLVGCQQHVTTPIIPHKWESPKALLCFDTSRETGEVRFNVPCDSPMPDYTVRQTQYGFPMPTARPSTAEQP
jgi:hypothetical protein